jgi:hypothetical protein
MYAENHRIKKFIGVLNLKNEYRNYWLRENG